ncbi:MAG: 3-deoxy-D-manno-octulosonic acid transferase, partial [Bacteroidota bacterium]
MKFLYNTGIYLYVTAIRLASLYNKKAKIWIDGRRRLLKEISQTIPEFTKIIWVHCSSLGEFEQGRPVIERLKSRCPDYKILLTFFSPSGYEIRKHYPGADYVFYLPADTPGNARKFIDHTRPAMALFIKYEYWYNYLNVLQEKKIPVFLFSAIFRPGQIFFRWYGKWWKKILFMFDHIFVQNESSGHLLKKSGITSVTVSGDTRFDRVHQIASNVKPIAIARDFLNNAFTVIAGSTWPVDEALLVEFINNNQENIKWIIAPHEIKSDQLMKLQSSITKPAVFYSQVTREKLPASDYNVLIIDNIGMLSSLYTYGQVA